MYSASAYYEIVEKMLIENVLLKKFKPLKSYSLLSNCFNNGGILDNFTKPLNQNNFIEMQKTIVRIKILFCMLSIELLYSIISTL